MGSTKDDTVSKRGKLSSSNLNGNRGLRDEHHGEPSVSVCASFPDLCVRFFEFLRSFSSSASPYL